MRQYLPHSKFAARVVKRLLFVTGLLLFVTGYGTIGFWLIEDSSFFDSFYMSAITLTTVGFGETIPLSQFGRLFAVSLIYLGVTGSGFSVAVLTNILFEETLLDILKGRRMIKKLVKVRDHYIVCGCGTTGSALVEELTHLGETVVVIDQRKQEELGTEHTYCLTGDARKDEVLVGAGIRRAKGLASCLTEDADNVFVALTARSLNEDLKIVSRFRDPDTERKLEMAGADHAVSPYKISGHRLAVALSSPALMDLLEATVHGSALNVHFQRLFVPERSAIHGKKLRDAEVRFHSKGALIIAVVDGMGQSVFNPEPDFLLEDIEQIIVLGNDEQFDALQAYLEGR